MFFVVAIVSQFMQVPCIDYWNVIIHILIYLKRLQDNIYYMKIKETPKSLSVAMLIGSDPLEKILFIRKVRNKM